MKGRLSSTIGLLVLINGLGLLAVLVLAYGAGARSGGLSLADFGALSRPAGLHLLGALLVTAVITFFCGTMLRARVLKPTRELVAFSEQLAAGNYKTSSAGSAGDFGTIIANLNGTAERAERAVASQQAQAELQRSVTDFLTIVSQIARGDLSLRGTVTKDALGNVVDSVNYMLDNFTKVLERVRKAAIDVHSSANDILVASEQMANGATQQDQEITNTSSAVEELTVSMKQVSHNAEASAESARRALDAAEQEIWGNSLRAIAGIVAHLTCNRVETQLFTLSGYSLVVAALTTFG